MGDKHKAVVYKWEEGRLRVTESFFEKLEEAVSFLKSIICHDSKIYDENGILVDVGKYNTTQTKDNTYA